MIFCTLCYGDYWPKKYSADINKISENHSIYVYTNKPGYFKSSCNIIEYKRKDFSYFEKLVLLLNLIDTHKERVTYFDSDSIYMEQVQSMLNDTHTKFNEETIYTHKVYQNEKYSISELSKDVSLVILMNVYKQLGFDNVICNYPHERILSIPYIPNKFETLKENILNVQSIWEENWYMGKDWPSNHQCNRWSQYGCGYGEGGALSIYAKELNIKLDIISSVNRLL